MKDPITWQDFDKIEFRCGTIIHAEVFAEARKPAYRLQVDFGGALGVLKSSAQITDHYQPDDLMGMQVLAVVNFPPKQIGPLMSECLVCGFVDDSGKVVLATPERTITNGQPLA